MTKTKKNNYSGLTLIEAVVYVALFGILMISLFTFTLGTAENNLKAEKKVEMEYESIFISEHLNNSFKSASSINELDSTFNSDQGVLSFVSNSITQSYQIQNGSLVFFDGIDTTPITSSIVTPTKFYIEKILDSENNLQGIRYTITFVSNKENSITRTLENSVILLKY